MPQEPDQSNLLLEAALDYARRRWRVIPLHNQTPTKECTCQKWRDSKGIRPCPSIGKHARYRGWQKDASTEESQIRAWWKQTPLANVGIVSGKASNLWVFDTDPRNGGEESRRALIYKHGQIPYTVTTHTGGGGSHEYFLWPDFDLPSAIELEDGLDIVGEEHIVVAPPSIHPSGRHYVWEAELAPEEIAVQPAPVWLLDLIRAKLQSKIIPAGKEAGVGEKKEYPPADFAQILQGCGWLRHCSVDARSLGEPEWYAQLSIVGRCKDGETLAHDLSSPHPEYNASSAAAKLRRALTDTGPVTCAKVRHSLGGSRFCDECPNFGKVKSPIVLGIDRPRNMLLDLPAPTDEDYARSGLARPLVTVDGMLPADLPEPPVLNLNELHETVSLAIGQKDQSAIMAMASLFARLEDMQLAVMKAKIRSGFGRAFRFPDLDKAIRSEARKLMASERVEAEIAWKSLLLRSKNGSPKSHLSNAITALRHSPEWDGVLWRDEFAECTVARKKPPLSFSAEGKWTSLHDILTCEWLQKRGIDVSVPIAGMAAEAVAYDRRFHPVQEYLKQLHWDGQHRLERWLTDYLGAKLSGGAQIDGYLEAVGAKWLLSAVARVFRPGCKADCALILEGQQGTKKSSALRVLGKDWFTDQVAELGSKDSSMQTHGIWIIEISELGSMSKAEVDTIKAFMSRQTERYRPPYAGRLAEVPRQCIFAGTVNGQSYLRDETGGRRFWPVDCGRIDLERLAEDCDHLWAETMARYVGGSVWWLDDPKITMQAQSEQADRYREDPWDNKVLKYIQDHKEVSIELVFREVLDIPVGKWGQPESNRIAAILTNAGWRKTRLRIGDKRSYAYRPYTEAAKLAAADQLAF